MTERDHALDGRGVSPSGRHVERVTEHRVVAVEVRTLLPQCNYFKSNINTLRQQVGVLLDDAKLGKLALELDEELFGKIHFGPAGVCPALNTRAARVGATECFH